MNRRVGRFTIEREIIDNAPDVAKTILRDLIVVRAEMLYASNVIEYIAIGDIFDEVSEGEITPWYDVKAEVRTESHNLYSMTGTIEKIPGERRIECRFVRQGGSTKLKINHGKDYGDWS